MTPNRWPTHREEPLARAWNSQGLRLFDPTQPPLVIHDAAEAEDGDLTIATMFECGELFPTPTEPSLQWFLGVEHRRKTLFGRWLPQWLSAEKHAGESVLFLGQSVGTDAQAFAREGARVWIAPCGGTEIALAVRQSQLREAEHQEHGTAAPRILAVVDPAHLPLEDHALDLVCIPGLLHQSNWPEAILAEAMRVLKPGGKLLAVVPAATRSWKKWWLRRSARPEDGFSSRSLRRLFHPFARVSVVRRHVRRSDVRWWLRWWPRTWLERCVGRFLLLTAFKPFPAATRWKAAA